jgi:hypothetical protein
MVYSHHVSMYQLKIICINNVAGFMPVILATQEAEIWRITV